VPPVQFDDFVAALIVQFVPPSWLKAVTRPREPPLFQRSCCHAATMLSLSDRSTATHGSTSLLTTFVPDAG
jgi:hypothetical protein